MKVGESKGVHGLSQKLIGSAFSKEQSDFMEELAIKHGAINHWIGRLSTDKYIVFPTEKVAGEFTEEINRYFVKNPIMRIKPKRHGGGSITTIVEFKVEGNISKLHKL